MLVFIYYWLIERTKYFSASFFFFVPKHRKNVAKPQKNLSSDPKIIIILSFKNLTKNPKRTTNTSQAPLQLPAFSRLHALQHHFRHPSCPAPLCPQQLPLGSHPALTTPQPHTSPAEHILLHYTYHLSACYLLILLTAQVILWVGKMAAKRTHIDRYLPALQAQTGHGSTLVINSV